MDGCKRLNYRFGYEIIKQNKSLDHKDYQLNSLRSEYKNQSIYEGFGSPCYNNKYHVAFVFNNSQRTGDNQLNFTSK